MLLMVSLLHLISIKYKCNNSVIIVLHIRGLVLRFRSRYTKSSRVATVASIIPPTAAPMTAGYALNGRLAGRQMKLSLK